MSEMGTGRALTLDQLWTTPAGVDITAIADSATPADLISVLESLGAERVESHWAYDYEGERDQTALIVDEPGSYIVWRIEEKE